VRAGELGPTEPRWTTVTEGAAISIENLLPILVGEASGLHEDQAASLKHGECTIQRADHGFQKPNSDVVTIRFSVGSHARNFRGAISGNGRSTLARTRCPAESLRCSTRQRTFESLAAVLATVRPNGDAGASLFGEAELSKATNISHAPRIAVYVLDAIALGLIIA
jgi:hypothetical protein